MRTILKDWMMEFCMEFILKRQTFSVSVIFVDRYLSIVKNVPKYKILIHWDQGIVFIFKN